ncbi:arabinose efflux permease family protein [Saccharomonospora marina XMU15]|uniref:Arabinose efflux permease family protein n=1 Tax=Saccharomonospora marina XMU15 TaxID=882083 RepID=H5X4V1_9PSEU|nr:MFS transporter [Saccharomonospora marina]EHR52230.1 arabinose efflux permease family protein [Saccharomonospora marina XMU15]
MSATTRQRPAHRFDRLPLGVYLLAFSLFAMGSAEFLLAGVLPAVAVDLDVSLPSAGALITAFALGVVLGGPPFAVLSLRWSRRTALLTSQLVFAAGIAVGLVTDYWVLLCTRFVSGLAYAGFFAVATVTAVSLVSPDRKARASGVVVSGLSVAMVAGGPVGTLLSQLTRWQAGFWAVTVLTLVGAIGCAFGLPSTRSGVEPMVSAELAVMRKPRLWNIYAITILSTAAYMLSFNYLAAILTDVTHIPQVWISAVLALFGAGAFVGLTVGGRIADRYPRHAILAGAIGIATLSALLASFADRQAAVAPIVFLLGVAAFVLNPALYGRVFTIATDAPTLAGATTVSAFQLGISLTPVFAAMALGFGGPINSVAWIGALLAVLTVPLALLDRPPVAAMRTDGA